MKHPFMLVNLKTYAEGTGKKALEIAKICERISKGTNIDIAICAQPTDIRMLSENVKLPIFAQHADIANQGAFTGHVTVEALQDAGAQGTLINHSEKPVTIEQANKIIQKAKEYGLITVFCTPSPVTVERIRKYAPDYIAIEPPELIGGNISVSTAKPQVITESITKAKGIPVICGAGIKTKEDCEKAIELGAFGILVASGVVKAKNIEKEVISLCEGLKYKG